MKRLLSICAVTTLAIVGLSGGVASAQSLTSWSTNIDWGSGPGGGCSLPIGPPASNGNPGALSECYDGSSGGGNTLSLYANISIPTVLSLGALAGQGYGGFIYEQDYYGNSLPANGLNSFSVGWTMGPTIGQPVFFCAFGYGPNNSGGIDYFDESIPGLPPNVGTDYQYSIVETGTYSYTGYVDGEPLCGMTGGATLQNPTFNVQGWNGEANQVQICVTSPEAWIGGIWGVAPNEYVTAGPDFSASTGCTLHNT
jgi:hypothetical protein